MHHARPWESDRVTDADPKPADDEKPAHTVYLDAFSIDRTEAANAQVVRFLNRLGAHAGACGGHDCLEDQHEDADSHILKSLRNL